MASGGGAKAEDCKCLAVGSTKGQRWWWSIKVPSPVPDWSIFPTHTQGCQYSLALGCHFLGHHSEDSLLIKLFTHKWFAGLPALFSAALTRSAGHITGPLGSLQENFPCENTRENAPAQSVTWFRTFLTNLTEATWAAQLLVFLDYMVLLFRTAPFSGNPSHGFPISSDSVFSMYTVTKGCQWLKQTSISWVTAPE